MLSMSLLVPSSLVIASRSLYDPNYVNSPNCTSAYDETTNMDTTIGTYLTDYIMGVIGMISALYLLSYKRHHRQPLNATVSSSASETNNCTSAIMTLSMVWMASYMFIFGFGFVIAGIQHQVIASTTQNYEGFLNVSYSLVGVGILCLQFHIFKSKLVRIGFTLILLVLLVVFVFFNKDMGTFMLAIGIYIFIVQVFLAGVYYFGYCQRDFFKGMVGFFTIGAGFMVQGFLADTCGGDGYKDCFQNCPLPSNPMIFNHNAVFHVLVIIGMIFQTCAKLEPRTSNTTAPKEEKNNNARHSSTTRTESINDNV